MRGSVRHSLAFSSLSSSSESDRQPAIKAPRLMTQHEEHHYPYVPITFIGDWSDGEEDKIRQAISAAEATMPASLRRRLKGSWLAKATLDAQTGRYIAVHRLGIGVAFTGDSADAIVQQIKARWPQPRMVV